MAYTRSRTFCCCLPVRLGVFLIAILGLLGGSTVVAAGIIQIRRTHVGKTSLVIQIVMYSLLALISILGLIGAITRRRKIVAIFWALLTAELVLSIISGIYALHSFFINAPANINACIGESEDPAVAKSCNKAESITKAVMVVIFVFIWLIQLYGCIIVDNYTKQLAEEEDAHFKEEVGRPTW